MKRFERHCRWILLLLLFCCCCFVSVVVVLVVVVLLLFFCFCCFFCCYVVVVLLFLLFFLPTDFPTWQKRHSLYFRHQLGQFRTYCDVCQFIIYILFAARPMETKFSVEPTEDGKVWIFEFGNHFPPQQLVRTMKMAKTKNFIPCWSPNSPDFHFWRTKNAKNAKGNQNLFLVQ